MSELEKYRNKYSDLVSLIANLHNEHVRFCNRPSFEAGVDLRRVLRIMRVVEKELWNASQKSVKELKANTRMRLQKQRDDKSLKKQRKTK